MRIIHCRCPACGATIKVGQQHLGRKAKCPRCSAPIVIPAEEPESGFPHIVTDVPESGPGPRPGSSAAGRGRTGDRTFRLGFLISAAAVVLLVAAIGVFFLRRSAEDSAPKAQVRRPPSPPTAGSPDAPARPEGTHSTLVLDWPEGERTESIVEIDGSEQRVPSSGPVKFDVKPGEHRIVLLRRGYEPIEIGITFEKGGHHHYSPVWRQAALAAVDPGRAGPAEPPSSAPTGTGRTGHEPRAEGVKPTPKPKEPPAAPKEPPSESKEPAPEPTVPADPGSPEELLAGKGLRRLSDCFSLAGESEVSDKLREAESLKKKAFDAQQKVGESQQIVDEKKRLMLAYVQKSRELGAQLQFARNVDQHNQIVTALNELDARVLIMRQSDQEEKALDQAWAAAAETREQYAERLLELRRLYGEVGRQYEALAADPAVSQAIQRHSETVSKTYRLGPTILFARMASKLERLEKTVLSEEISLRRGEGSLWYVSAVFNGKFTQEMAIDTGASVIALSWQTAQAVGLAPSDDAPSVLVEVADGRVVEAKRVVAETVRVGKFTAKNVECAVMPSGLPASTPLLGLSFFKNFSFKIDSGKGQLIMSQIDASETGG